MNLGDQLAKSQQEDEEARQRRRDKFGDYSDDPCTNCGRVRVMVGKDGKHRCEKCAWCLEDNNYDSDLFG